MKLARYMGGGVVAIVDEPEPQLPPGGLVVRTEASGLCSGELMDWYMDQKAPHVLGHEVAGIVEQSDDSRFPVGCRVAPHHHAPDPESSFTKRGAAVHDPIWKATRLIPGGLAERFAVPAANLADTWRVDDLRPQDAALMEPFGCVMKSLRRLRLRGDESVAVIGLGVMGLLFMAACPGAVGCDLDPNRIDWARRQGWDARPVEQMDQAEVVVVCPGSEAALAQALALAAPDPRIVLFAPMPPGSQTPLDLHRLYFQDLTLSCSYSCGPEDTRAALEAIRAGQVKAEQVVSHFISLDELPEHYLAMKRQEIIKPMVLFPDPS